MSTRPSAGLVCAVSSIFRSASTPPDPTPRISAESAEDDSHLCCRCVMISLSSIIVVIFHLSFHAIEARRHERGLASQMARRLQLHAAKLELHREYRIAMRSCEPHIR